MKQIDVISVPVTDQQRAKEFYLKLGFELMAENRMEDGQTWIQLGLENSFTSITLVTWFKKMLPGSLQGLVIRTDTIAADVAALQSQGIEMPEIEETPWGKFASFKDPDGNGWSLHERT